MARLKLLTQTPAALGYSFPPEWHPHAGTWFSWPRPEGISFPGRYEPIPQAMARIIRHITPREQVHINVPNENYQHLVTRQLRENGCPTDNVHFHHIRTNEAWCRDHGPAFVLRRRRTGTHAAAIVDWGFNAWGGKYPPYDDDNQVPRRVAELLGLPAFAPGIIMEGGSVDFNGQGAILTTEQCLLNRNRNPRLGRKRIEQYLKDYYGQRQVIWLGDGIEGDDTDGHIDDLARFISATTVVIGIEQDPRDANHKVLQDNLRRLELARDAAGRPFDIVQIPMPGTVEHDGQRLPATYVNFYFINGALLVPTYGHRKNDRKALETLQKHLPGRQVIGIDCTDLIWGLGAIHCLTQQQPRF
jgi:agmatine deiminase